MGVQRWPGHTGECVPNVPVTSLHDEARPRVPQRFGRDVRALARYADVNLQTKSPSVAFQNSMPAGARLGRGSGRAAVGAPRASVGAAPARGRVRCLTHAAVYEYR